MRSLLIGLLVMAAHPLAAAAQVISERPEAVSVVIYPSLGEGIRERQDSLDASSGLVLVIETRTVDLPAGPATIAFKGVSEHLFPASAAIEGLPAPVAEANFDFALLSPGALLRRSEGQAVEVVRTGQNGAHVTRKGIVRSAGQGLVLDFGGEIEPLRCGDVPQRIRLDSIPTGLGESPTLSVRTVSPKAGRYVLKLRYLASGVGWSADYVARVQPDGRHLDITAWITIANFGQAGYPSAEVKVIGGEVRREYGEENNFTVESEIFDPGCWREKSGRIQTRRSELARRISTQQEIDACYQAAGDNDAALAACDELANGVNAVVSTGSRIRTLSDTVGDYKLFSIVERTNIAPQQTKQVMLFEREGVPFKRRYEIFFDLYEDDVRAFSFIAVENTARNGLGIPLPTGVFSLIDQDRAGRKVFAGEGGAVNTPEGGKVEFGVGRALDIEGRAVKIRTYAVQGKERSDYVLTVTNRKSESIKIDAWTDVSWDHRVISSDRKYTMMYGSTFWPLQLRPGATTTIRYTIEKDAD